ncbi:MAG: hypothetical protein ACPGUF_04710 [Litorivicinus sp.]
MAKVTMSEQGRAQLQNCLSRYLSDLYRQGEQQSTQFSTVSELLSKVRQRNAAGAMELADSELRVLESSQCIRCCKLTTNKEKVAN